MILSSIKSPEDLKNVPKNRLPVLSDEIRSTIIETVAKNGGHLASNLGVVELTIALHRSFSSPKDAIVWDVSHQCYAHKLLTGRFEKFKGVRQHDGISGFTKMSESEHDYFDNGHASTSISSSLGLLTARSLLSGENNPDAKVVAVIGDGSLTGGLAFEGLCHAGQLQKNLIVVLNDNQMSIGQNKGALSRYLSRMTMSSSYQNIRYGIDTFVQHIPFLNKPLSKFIYKFKRGLKGIFLSNNMFVDLGFEYVGPLDGHDISEMEMVFSRVKKLPRPVVVHILTKKGKGYKPAEHDPQSFHGIGPFNISDGLSEKYDTVSFTECFSNAIVKAGEKYPNLVAITAAMAKGTGLDAFARHFPNRFFDVGIAEEHAVTFAGGLAKGGIIPVVCIYSTFIQRSVDQIIHDVSLPDYHVIFMLDRAGAVPADGETHQGIFDIALFRPVPGLTILSPACACELEQCLETAIHAKGPVVIRYPKLSCPTELEVFKAPFVNGRGLVVKASEFAASLEADFENKESVEKTLVCCTGSMFSEVMVACRGALMKGTYADIYNIRYIKPFDEEYLLSVAKQYQKIVIVEDGIKEGGAGEYIQGLLALNGMCNVKVLAFPQKYIGQGKRSEVLEDAGLSSSDIEKVIMEK
ncbi:MAG: 1-deoxy-D-xylulose-5-phosphate synthase [Treponema sp.]|nr:1-deoxy-D-xylulose-5-phosphate synthase [Treponema sp.]